MTVKSTLDPHESTASSDVSNVAREIVLWFEVPSELSAIDELWDAVEAELSREAQIDEATLLDFRLSLIEATTNAIIHGHGEDGRTLTVEVLAAPHRLEAAVHDSGPGFQLSEALMLPNPEAESGRGLWMMEQLLDEIRYEREGPQNVMHLAVGPASWQGTS